MPLSAPKYAMAVLCLAPCVSAVMKVCVCEILCATTCLVKESHTVSVHGVAVYLSVLTVSYLHTYSMEQSPY